MIARIRPSRLTDGPTCEALVRENWGGDAADRFCYQFYEAKHPRFFVAAELDTERFMGFSAFEPTMLMRDYYHLIWLAVGEEFKGLGFGKSLTKVRLDAIRMRGGSMVSLVTQKTAYFARFGFRPIDPMDNGWTLMSLRLSEVRI